MYSTNNALRISRDLRRLLKVTRTSATASDSLGDISRPARIHREPTAVLKALAACVKDDPTAAHHRYHDDPFLIPMSNAKKRAYAMSAEAGRKAAVWVRSKHENLFSLRIYDPPHGIRKPFLNADPPIEAYLPPPLWDHKVKPTEEDLVKIISLSRLEDSVRVYRTLETPPALETKLALLQLLAYHNETEPLSERWNEERWFRQGHWNTGDKFANTWKNNALAEEIFLKLEEKPPLAYCAIIQGMCKHHQATRAFELYQEAVEKKIPLNTSVYNALLSVCGFLKQGSEQRRTLVTQLLEEMQQQGLTPNIGTLNSGLEGILGPGTFTGVVTPADKSMAVKFLAEMESIGIIPSAATWYQILCIFCRERGPRSDALKSIITRLEEEDANGKPDSLMPPRDPKDTYFFVSAMQICADHLQDMDLAMRLDALLQVGDRKCLLADGYKESVYRRFQVSILAKSLPLDDFLKIYDRLVPHRYIPEPSVMEHILKSIGSSLTYSVDLPAVNAERLEKMWNQLVAAGHTKRQRLLEMFLQVSTLAVKLEDDTEELERFKRICNSLWEGVEQQPADRTIQINWTGDMLSNLIAIYHACGDWEGAKKAVWRLRGDVPNSPIPKGIIDVIGVPRDSAPLLNIPKWALENKDPSTAAAVASFLFEAGFPESLDAAKSALSVMLAASDIEYFSGCVETELDNLEGHTKELLLVYRNSESNKDTSSSSSQSSSSSDEENVEKKPKSEPVPQPTTKNT